MGNPQSPKHPLHRLCPTLARRGWIQRFHSPLSWRRCHRFPCSIPDSLILLIRPSGTGIRRGPSLTQPPQPKPLPTGTTSPAPTAGHGKHPGSIRPTLVLVDFTGLVPCHGNGNVGPKPSSFRLALPSRVSNVTRSPADSMASSDAARALINQLTPPWQPPHWLCPSLAPPGLVSSVPFASELATGPSVRFSGPIRGRELRCQRAPVVAPLGFPWLMHEPPRALLLAARGATMRLGPRVWEGA